MLLHTKLEVRTESSRFMRRWCTQPPLRLKARPVARGDWVFDWLGLFFFVLFIAPLLIALSQFQKMTLASSTLALSLIGIALVSLLLLLKRENRAKA